MATTVSVILLALIMGLGCFGASADYCQQAFNDAGYTLTDSQLDTIVDIANDPYTKSFAQRHESALMDTYTKVTNGDGYTIADIFVSQSTYDPTLDALHAYWENVMPDEAKLGYAIAEAALSEALNPSNKLSIPTDTIPANQRYYLSDGSYFMLSQNFYSDTSGSDKLTYESNLYFFDALGNATMIRQQYYQQGIDPKGADYFLSSLNVVDNGNGTYALTTTTKYAYYAYNPAISGVGWMPHSLQYNINYTVADTTAVADQTFTFDINPDGTVTLPDGTVINPNADGSYTIDGKNYYPDPALPTDKDALGWIFSHVTDDKLDDIKFDDKTDSDTNTDVRENIDAQVAEYEGDLSEFMLGSGITQIFPFCLPFDLAKGIKLFVAQPITPKFVIPINIPALLNFPAIKTEIVVDFSKYGTLVTLCRWFSTAGFIFF